MCAVINSIAVTFSLPRGIIISAHFLDYLAPPDANWNVNLCVSFLRILINYQLQQETTSTYRLDKIVKGRLDKANVFCQNVINGVWVDFDDLASDCGLWFNEGEVHV